MLEDGGQFASIQNAGAACNQLNDCAPGPNLIISAHNGGGEQQRAQNNDTRHDELVKPEMGAGTGAVLGLLFTPRGGSINN
jgi:hypothetical protein